jgi:hypothetical protein
VVGQDSLNRFDNNFNKKKNKKPNRPNPNTPQAQIKTPKPAEAKTEKSTPVVQGNQPSTTPQGEKPAFKKKKRRKPPRRDGDTVSQGPKTETNA